MARTKPVSGTIYGDDLLLAFEHIERSYAAFVANPLGDDLPYVVWNALKADIEHPYGDAHWYGEIVLRAHTRSVLDAMDGQTRYRALFDIGLVAKNAIDATCDPAMCNGLHNEDKKKLVTGLTRFLMLVACDDIKVGILLNP